MDRGASGRGDAFDVGAVYREMVEPAAAPRVKQWHDFTARWIDSSQIWSLPKIAAVASQRKIPAIVRSPMLPGDDVFNVMDQLAMLLPEQAVFTTVMCAAADQLPQRGVHC